jgi:hypothetical protein
MAGVEVTINGKRACVVSTADIAFFLSILEWRAQDGFALHVRGMADAADGSSEHLTWLIRKLELGDVVTFRIAEAERSDEPLERAPVAKSHEA